MSHADPSLQFAWLVPLFPLIGFLINGVLLPFVGKGVPKTVIGAIGTVAVFASFVVACLLFSHVAGAADGAKQGTAYLAHWLAVPGMADLGYPKLEINFELLIDPLSALMMLIITGVGGLIHLYSMGYMAADPDYRRFFTYLNLFVFFMLLLVMANNLLLLFVGWEGVGLCSYLLVGYFFFKNSAADAAKKAFIVNRIGDVGVLIGMFFLFHYFGTLDFFTGQSGVKGILEAAPQLVALATPAVITTILLMLFLGCTGKSAQIPLYTWLPDAMEGPTPVSALIHAATMVTAGIYLVARMHSVFVLSDTAMITVAVTGIATALFAATIGLMQNDIKRVLAYSTVSQLGYMFAACGAGVFAAGMYHVMTHAFFKACLFLGSGSVIHAIEHGMHAAHDSSHDSHDAAAAEHSDTPDTHAGGAVGADPHDPQDMRNMGGLLGKIPLTAGCMIAATAAIAGVWPFAGFWSKDQILWRAWQVGGVGGWVFWGVGAVTALITAFYMVRLVMKTFFGAPRTDAAKNAHESPLTMTIPVAILAVLSFVAGWPILPLGFAQFSHFLAPSVGDVPEAHNENMEPILGWGIFLVILAVIVVCYMLYHASKNNELMTPEEREDRRPFVSKGWFNWVLLNKYFVDEAYNFWFVRLGKRFSDWLWQTFDIGLVDGVVNGVAQVTRWTGSLVRRGQTGLVRNYAFLMVVGIIFVLLGCLAGLNGVK